MIYLYVWCRFSPWRNSFIQPSSFVIQMSSSYWNSLYFSGSSLSSFLWNCLFPGTAAELPIRCYCFLWASNWDDDSFCASNSSRLDNISISNFKERWQPNSNTITMRMTLRIILPLFHSLIPLPITTRPSQRISLFSPITKRKLS